MLRVAILAVGLVGCDRVFALTPVPDPVPPDAAPDVAEYPAGCSDGSREGFGALETYPDLAGCAGAWSVPGLRDVAPMCALRGGNDGVQLDGAGCSAADLCAPTWHVCQSSIDVALSQPTTLRSCAGLGAAPNTLFATAQSGAAGNCDEGPAATNDFMGCGTAGPAAMANCAPLDRSSDNMCFSLTSVGWNCPDPDNEVNTVTKSMPLVGGGVLCCRDR